jgi:hypothetical protein
MNRIKPFRRLLPALLLGLSATAGVLIATNAVAIASNRAETQSPTELVAAFQRERTAMDSLPMELAADWSAVLAQAPADNSAGVPDYEQSRLAQPGASRIWLVPTTTGQLCRIREDLSAAGGCIDSSHLGSDGIDWGLVDSDGPGPAPTVVWGLVSSTVSKISAITPTGDDVAALDEGAFEIRATAFPKALLVAKTDGTTLRIEVPPPPR